MCSVKVGEKREDLATHEERTDGGMECGIYVELEEMEEGEEK